ncbi:hypothetical protein CVU75_03050 [Candidatus Dependentiae bacterium HGW-Dependentiae-1]|nr:MAG: hypothetical protein CVU75_03050 [Candidatus Dependentiae bacterium HGW-Dependentiae-1]
MYLKKCILLSTLLLSTIPINARLIVFFNQPDDTIQRNNLTSFIKLALIKTGINPVATYLTDKNQINTIQPEDLVLYVLGTSYVYENRVIRDYFFDEENFRAILKKTPHVIIVGIDIESPAPDFDTHITSNNPPSGIFLGQKNKEEKIVIRLIGKLLYVDKPQPVGKILLNSPLNDENVQKLATIITKIMPEFTLPQTQSTSFPIQQSSTVQFQQRENQQSSQIAPQKEPLIHPKLIIPPPQSSQLLKDSPQARSVSAFEPRARTILRSIHLQLQDLARTTHLDAADKQTIEKLLKTFETAHEEQQPPVAGPSKTSGVPAAVKSTIPPELPVPEYAQPPAPMLAPTKDLPFWRANSKAQYKLNSYFEQKPQARTHETLIRDTVKQKLLNIHRQGEKITPEIISRIIYESDEDIKTLF